MKYLIVLLVIFLASCATNEFDAQIAIAKANVEIAEHNIEVERERGYNAALEVANRSRPLVEMSGPWECKEVDGKSCDFIVNNPFQKVIAPEREKGFVDGMDSFFNGTTKLATALLPLGIAKEVTNLAGEVSKNAGGNTTNSNSYNQANVSKTAGADLADSGSAIDKSKATTSTDSNDNYSVTSTDSNDNSSVTSTDSNDNNSTTTNTDDNSTVTNTDDNSSAVTTIQDPDAETVTEPEPAP